MSYELKAAAQSLLAVTCYNDNGKCSLCGGYWPDEHREHCQGARLALVLDSLPPSVIDEWRANNACDVCGNMPDEDGNLEHGRGCYTQSEDGGGTSFVEPLSEKRVNE